MKNESQILIRLLSNAIHNQIPDLVPPSELPWTAIYEEAKDHQVHSLLYPTIMKLPPEIRPDQQLLSTWQRDTYVVLSEQLNHMEIMKELLSLFQTEGIAVILLKGLILRNYYPQPELRTMSDADLLVHSSDIDKIRNILLSYGYVEAMDTIKHIGFYHNNYPGIELHWMLSKFEETNQTCSLTDQMWRNAIEDNIDGIPVLIPSAEDQFLHQILHLVNHFTTSGFGLRQLCDLTLFLEANHRLIDWTFTNEQLMNYKVKQFADVILSICNRLLVFDKSALKSEPTEELSYIDLMIEDILKSGVYGNRTPDRKASYSYIQSSDYKSTNSLKGLPYIVRLIFPSVKYLGTRYSYIRKHPYLLPLAWIQRAVKNLNRIEFLKYSKEIKVTSQERAKLLRWLQLP